MEKPSIKRVLYNKIAKLLIIYRSFLLFHLKVLNEQIVKLMEKQVVDDKKDS